MNEYQTNEHEYQRDVAAVRRRLARQSTVAIGMLEAALDALWAIDAEVAEHVRSQDDTIDAEEVAIEQEAYRILALAHPVARDFRILTTMVKVNHDVERVADHACSIAKVVMRLASLTVVPRFPTSLRELGDRVPGTCHQLLRALMEEDASAANSIVRNDKTLDRLDRIVFEEIATQIVGGTKDEAAAGLLLYRVGRDLERVGDLMKNIAENVMYLDSGKIVRHASKAKPRRPSGDAGAA
ncbi:MAG: phosphate signaling complex protein PhoU [Planctomycetota bacterium]